MFHPLNAETQRLAVSEKREIRRGGVRSTEGGSGTERNVETVISGILE